MENILKLKKESQVGFKHINVGKVLHAAKIINHCSGGFLWDYVVLTDYGHDFERRFKNGCKVLVSIKTNTVFILELLSKKESKLFRDTAVGRQFKLDCNCLVEKCEVSSVALDVEYAARWDGCMVDER